MHRRLHRRAALFVLVLTALVLNAACGAAAEPATDEVSSPTEGQTGGPVVVELFTSQGCSSCPPADRLLSQLGADEDFGDRVIPLAYHVDYWNYIGWKDPFSSAQWSRRQERYASVLREGRVYTPQLVVGGRVHTVGSRQSEVKHLIDKALAETPAASVAVRAASTGEDQVTVHAEALLESSVDGAQELFVALVEDGLETRVQTGENARRTLRNDHVVRALQRATSLEGSAGAHGEGDVVFTLDPEWPREKLQVVAFLQDRDTLEIHGGAATRLAP